MGGTVRLDPLLMLVDCQGLPAEAITSDPILGTRRVQRGKVTEQCEHGCWFKSRRFDGGASLLHLLLERRRRRPPPFGSTEFARRGRSLRAGEAEQRSRVSAECALAELSDDSRRGHPAVT